MPWSSGTFTRGTSDNSGAATWVDEQADGYDIEASRHDTHDQDLATGINSCLTKDGTNSPSGSLTWHDTIRWAGSTGGSSTAYTASLSPSPAAYYGGMLVRVQHHTTNGASAALNLNSLGAKALRLGDGTVACGTGTLRQGSVSLLSYDATNGVWIVLSNSAWNIWISTTPTLTSSMGTASISYTYSKYKIDGNTITFSYAGQVTLSGSASSTITLTTPTSMANYEQLNHGAWVINGGSRLGATIKGASTTTFDISIYNGSNYSLTTCFFGMTGEYEAA